MLCSLKPNSLLKLEASIMAAAYAALMSLLNTSELILHPSQHWLRINIIQIESLLQKVRLLQEFLEDYSHRDHQEMAGVESQIADMAYEAEDVIECYVLAQIPARSTGSEVKYSTAFSQCIHKVIEEMEDLIKNKLMRIKESIGKFEEDPTFIDFSPAVSSRSAPSEQNTMVGSDEKLEEILDILTGQQSNRQIVAIVGMGGIGKTTLAKNVYEHPYIKNHFHICAWATISQKYSARNIIYEMLSEFGQSRSESHLSDDHELGLAKCDTGEEQLGEQLYKSLYGRRYLIVLDDLWSIEAWDEIKRFFPDHCNNGCRIMITTREKKVAAQLSSCRPFEMDLLDDNSSWELMREKVFGHQQGCRPELEELGKTIAKNCNGLPLAIVVIGGLLAKSDKTMNSWKHVAGNMKSIINSEDNEKCQKILYLSYKNLPIHLKPCFLYLAVARQPYNIDIPTLIKVWVSEGFVKPIRGKSLEEAADEYITDLVDRNLFILPRRGVLGNLLRCGVHDLLIDLCWREIEKIDLFRVIFDQNPKFMFQLRIHPSPLKPELGSVPRALGILGPASLSASDSTLLYAVQLQLLRVLIMTDSILPDENSQLMNLRFLSFHGHLDGNSILRFYSLMSLFWNLQTLHIHNSLPEPLSLPPEIWCLPHLRHLHIERCVLPDPPVDKHDSHILENLQTLLVVVFFRCSEEVCRRLPNLKELQVMYVDIPQGVEWPFFCLHNLVHLQKLQSLSFCTKSPISWEHLSFPLSLKELALIGCRLPWEDMSIVGSLPNLELLQLWFHACKGQTWCPTQGQFVKLKVLDIAQTDLVHWRADKTHFPVLEHLVLRYLNLEEFPQNFGEHPTLAKIEVFDCSDSTKAWAEQVGEEQENFGNEVFRVIIPEREENKTTIITSVGGYTLSQGLMIYD
ncbi:putative late blight resistance protein homolog R1B-16 isoform X1 [Henckelia pumila]|uniref:putative late blight resistance protein homolog R1B-16 isoform X1 n=1 Tax=Henckelia pumila TaxID=405737 RepID=UPI003C6E90E3